MIKGGKLLDLETKEGGVRHLFTAFPKEPTYLPDSPAFNRLNDHVITTSKLQPFAIIFFAFPKTQEGLRINFRNSFPIDDLINGAPEMGCAVMGLKYHDVFWCAYRTKHMDKWPKKNQIIFHDGYLVPYFTGIGLGELKLEFKIPKYTLQGNEFSIEI